MAAEAEGRRISPVFIAAGAAGALVLILLLFNLLGGGGGGGDEQPIATIPPQAGGAPGAAATPAPTPEPMEVFEIFEGKDPFRPLLFQQAAPTDGATPVPGETPAPTGSPGAATPVPTAVPRTPAPAGVQIELLSVAGDRQSANVRVGSQVHEGAKPGQTLSSGVVLVSIQGRCATFRKDPNTFQLCEGDMVLK